MISVFMVQTSRTNRVGYSFPPMPCHCYGNGVRKVSLGGSHLSVESIGGCMCLVYLCYVGHCPTHCSMEEYSGRISPTGCHQEAMSLPGARKLSDDFRTGSSNHFLYRMTAHREHAEDIYLQNVNLALHAGQ